MGIASRFKSFGGRHPRYHKGDVLFDSNEPKTTELKVLSNAVYEVEVVGGGGAAAIRGQYDDRGYGWGGGSGGAFVGVYRILDGVHSITVGKTPNNTKPQGGNTNTLNPDDTTKYSSKIEGYVEVGGGGAGTTSGVGTAGEAPKFTIEPMEKTLNTAGKAGVYGSGGKGSSIPPATCSGGDSVYEGHGKGQGCVVSEYASSRRWIDGTNGYVKITYRGME